MEVARERELLVLEDNPYGLLRYEGEALPPLYKLDGGVYVMYLGTFSKILSPGIRLGWVAAPPPVLEKINVGKQAADLCTSTLSQLMVQAYFEQGRWRDYVESLTEHLPAPARRDARGAVRPLPAPGRVDRARRRAVHLGHAARLHRHHRPAGAGAAGQRRVRARRNAAYLDGRGHSSMRLNFSGSSEDEIREGIRRVGKVIEEQVALFGTLTGKPAGRAGIARARRRRHAPRPRAAAAPPP